MSGPTSATLARELSGIGDALGAQLSALQADPTPERAESVSIQIGGAQQYVNRLRATLIVERDEG